MNDYLKTMESLWQGSPDTLRHRVGAKQFTPERLDWYFKRLLPNARWDLRRVLEYGCGIGRMTQHLANKLGPGTQVFGTDISVAMLKEAYDRCVGVANLAYFQTPGDGIPEPLVRRFAPFDFIYSVITLQHICSRSVVQKIFSSFAANLSDIGTFTVQVKQWRPGLRAWDYEPGPSGIPDYLPGLPKLPRQFHAEEGNAYTDEQLVQVLAASGLDTLSVQESEAIDDHGTWLWAYGKRLAHGKQV